MMRHLLKEAELKSGYETWDVAPNLTIYRRADGKPWERVIDRSGRVKKQKFYSNKNGCVVRGSSTGEAAAFAYLDASPWVKSYRPQGDLLAFTHEGNVFWSLPDAATHCVDERLVWIEGKFLHYVSCDGKKRFDLMNRLLAPLNLTHSVLDQGWCLHKDVAHNLAVVHVSQDLQPDAAGRTILLDALSTGPVTFKSAAKLLSGAEANFNQVFAAMGRGELQFEINRRVTPRTWVSRVFQPDWSKNPYHSNGCQGSTS